ncbi:MAG: hypothetical protein AB1665_00940 [Candidatus Thermoplasmatota archaeon]
MQHPRRGKGRKGGRPRAKRRYTPKKRRLNLRRLNEFKWLLNEILSVLPENVRGTLRGSIIAKADKIDVQAAIEFIQQKEAEGLIERDIAERLCSHVMRYTTYR